MVEEGWLDGQQIDPTRVHTISDQTLGKQSQWRHGMSSLTRLKTPVLLQLWPRVHKNNNLLLYHDHSRVLK